ncbi:MAG: hypothetical protein WCP21_17625, partial [Armatimonadota bacterium]
MRCALLVATGLLSCGLAVGQDSHSVRVHVSGAEQVSAHPGDIVTAAFTVTNDTAVEQRFVEALALPSGWQLLQPLSDFPLQAGASETRLVSLAVRRSAQAATYPLTYTVRAQGDSAVQDQSTIRVMVVGLSKIEALADSKS